LNVIPRPVNSTVRAIVNLFDRIAATLRESETSVVDASVYNQVAYSLEDALEQSLDASGGSVSRN